MNALRKSLPVALLLSSFSAHAIVDYTDSSSDRSSTNKVSSSAQSSKSESKSALIWKSDLSLSTNYESTQIGSDRMGFLNLNTHLQTPANIYFDLSYWQAQQKGKSQSGNPKLLLGFNWLRMGAPSEEARFDIYGGAKLKGSSEMASSHTDKIFGLETTKRFGTFGLGIGYDITLTGTPQKQDDMSVGNIHRISISSGWMISHDIQFELEMENYKVSESTDSSRSNRLNKSLSFSTLSPKLNLTIFPVVNVELGARFRTNKPKSDQDISTAKLYDLHGIYSNSLFAGINFNI